MQSLRSSHNRRNVDPVPPGVRPKLSAQRATLLFGLPFFIAACLYTVHLTSDLYGDEGSTFGVVSDGSFLANLMSPQLCHPPLYFVAAKVCYVLTGRPWSIRLPSLLCALGTVVLVMRMAFRIYGRGVALLALWLVALSPLLVEFAAEGRPYAMLAFFSTALAYQLWCFLRHEDWKSMLLVSGYVAGGLLTHYIFVVHAAFAACYYLVRRRRFTKYSVGALLIVSPVLVLLTLGLMHNAAQSAELARHSPKQLSSLLNFLARLPIALSFGFCTFRLPNLDFARNVAAGVFRDNILMMIPMTLALIGLSLTMFRLLLRKREWVGFLLCSIVVPGVLLLLGVLGGCFVAREKYLIGVVGTYMVLVAVAFDGARRSWKLRGIAVAYLLVVAVSLVHYTVYPNVYSRRMDWTGVRELLHAEMAKGDALVFYRAESDATRQVGPDTEGIKIIDIQAEAQKGYDIADIVGELAGVCLGRVFLVNNEIHRVYLDPRQQVVHSLKKERSFERHDFGRNLSVYIFFPQREHVSGDGKG